MFQQLTGELDEWQKSLPRNYLFEERSIYAFRSGRQVDMFLMIHVWYHQARCELHSIWNQVQTDVMDVDTAGHISNQFVEQCRKECLIHANNITSSIEKVLTVESDHVFRDAWLGFCILDSTRIQLSSTDMMLGDHVFDEVQLIAQLRVNMRALSNTKEIFPMTERIVSPSK